MSKEQEPEWYTRRVASSELPAWFIVEYGKGTRDFGIVWHPETRTTVRFSSTSDGFLGKEDAVLHCSKDSINNKTIQGDYIWEKQGIYKVRNSKGVLMRVRLALDKET